MNSSKKQKTVDAEEPAFEADERVAPLVEAGHAETFGLVLVAGWPKFRNDILKPYYRLKASVELCFDESDVASYERAKVPPVYLYPATALHVTVATLHSINEQDPGVLVPTERQNQLKAAWTNVVRQASQLQEWPTAPLELVLDSAQIGTRAGILLWNETTGGIESMRQCIRTICNTPSIRDELHKDYNISVDDTLMLPSIIHSTFLRFYRVPETPATVVQQRFRETVQPRLREFFPSPIRVTTATLVCERIPFMHIPADDHHVCLNMSFPIVDKKL
jgi:hypothetical protein